MMHMRRARRPHFHHLHPLVLGKMSRHNFVRIFHFSARRNLHRPRHLHHHIRLRNVPSFIPHVWRGRPARVSRRRSRLIPRRNGRNLLRTQRRIIRKLPISRIGKPRRHHLHLYRRCHLPRPWPRLLIGNQRHRRSLAASVATLAFILEDRKHILIKGRRRRSRSMIWSGIRSRVQRRTLGIVIAVH